MNQIDIFQKIRKYLISNLLIIFSFLLYLSDISNNRILNISDRAFEIFDINRNNVSNLQSLS